LLLLLCACGSDENPNANTWHKISSTPQPRVDWFAVSDGAHLYCIGGTVDAGTGAQPSAEVDVLAVGTNRWSRGPDLPPESAKFELAVAQDGTKIYVLTGFDGAMPKNTTFVLEGNQWRRLKDAPVARGGATAKSIGGKIYVAGGSPAEMVPSIAELDVYDPLTDSWSTGAPLPTPRENVASCVIDNKLVVIGGWNDKREVQNVVEAYDPNTNTWERWPDLPTARGGLGAVVLDNRCYTIGGETWSTPPPGTFGANEMFDPMSRRWAVLAPMPTPRHGLGLAVVGQEIWAVGGGPSQGDSYTSIIEAYRP
jgi:N-acetylneuraminic acid mutarotase